MPGLVIATFEANPKAGVLSVDGKMVDKPVIDLRRIAPHERNIPIEIHPELDFL